MTVTMAPSLAARGRHSDVPVVRTARGFRWGKLLETGVRGTVHRQRQEDQYFVRQLDIAIDSARAGDSKSNIRRPAFTLNSRLWKS